MTNNSRRKGNQAMKIGQLTEYNLRNIFLEKSHTKYGGETIPRSFFKKLKLSISADQYFKVFYILFILFIYFKTFLKNKKRSGTSFPASFSAWFLKRNIALVIFLYLEKFQYLFTFASWDIGQYVCCNSLLTRLWRNKFWD